MSDKSMLDQALDLFVYAPLGLALTARDQLPQLAERGRQQATSQVTLAKMMGDYAVKEAQKRGAERAEQAAAILRALGLVPGEPETAASPAPPPAPGPNGKAAGAAAARTAEPAPSGAHLAIPGYDTLSASQVVQRLAGLTADELEAVRVYEEDTRGRRTILAKVAQLQGPAAG